MIMYRFMEHTIQWLRTGFSRSDTRAIRESVLTVVFAALIGAIIVLLFVPSAQEIVWPALSTLLSQK